MSLTAQLCVLAALFCFAQAAEKATFVFGKNDMGSLAIKDTVVRSPQHIPSFDGTCMKHTAVSHSNGLFVTCEGKAYITGIHVGTGGQFSAATKEVVHTPTLIESLAQFKIVMCAAGDNHFAVLSDQGRVYTWGMNNEGQLGHGTDAPFATVPVEVADLANKNIRMIAAGGNRTGAISDSGKLYIWGAGSKGESGDGATRSHRKPNLVQAFVGSAERVCQIAIGGSHVVAVTNAGDLYTWGDGAAGQLGLGDFGMEQHKPMPVSRLRKNACFAAAGDDFTAVISQDERVFLWGSNGYPSPFEKSYFQGKHPRQIGSGASHMVVLLEDGTLASWGSRRNGQAGREFSSDFTLEPGTIDLIAGASQISVGRHQTVVLTNGFPAVSLCPCLNNWYSHWTDEEEYFARCDDGQSSCGDGSCCGGDETCCPAGDVSSTSTVPNYYAMTKRPSSWTPKFTCMAGINDMCCDAGSGLACPNNFKCNHDAMRCDVKEPRLGISDEELVDSSQEFVRSKKTAQLPGANLNEGTCGPRKNTCPDDTCCTKGSTCCQMKDGSFGCCQGENSVCCKSGCCAAGFECDESGHACIKKFGGAIVETFKQDSLQGHCGAGKRQCPDRSCCSEGHECCVLSDGFFGCCPFTNGVCCMDGAGCCPSGHTCDIANSQCVRLATDGKEVRVSMKATPRNTPQRSTVGETTCPNDASCPYPGSCCSSGDKFVCCDFVNGTCCNGGMGCCPRDYECNLQSSTCQPIGKGAVVPMKFTRDPKPKQHVTQDSTKSVCEGKTQCSDNSCCPLGSTCCNGPNGETKCCDYMEAVCCEDGGCCAAEHMCDNEAHVCRDSTGKNTYAYLSSQKSTAPPADRSVQAVSTPGKCYPDEMLCSDGFCCPRSATCCTKGFGQSGCCPHTHGVCCSGGGCCPGGSTCDNSRQLCTYPNDADKPAAPMLNADTPHPPESEWDVEECWEDEQACPIDGGCCLKTETCCVVESEQGLMSACCPHENGICCSSGGCCAEGDQCDDVKGVCIGPTGQEQKIATVKGSALHPLAGLAEKDCPDGSVCGPFDTCCSLGFDEEWGEEIFACCEFENAVCCKDFEGCCPSGYECNAETKTCLTEGREISGGSNSPTDPPPTFVCLWPQTQCPNSKCCEENEQCTAQGNGNYRCLPRGFVSCNNGTHGCPVNHFCDERRGSIVCSQTEANDQQVKQDLLRKFWGDDVTASCNSALIQSEHSTKQDDSFSPDIAVQHPPKQYWFPTKLVVRSKAVKTTEASLPTVQASKICQHLKLVNSTAVADYCFMSNANGHFLVKERDRVKQLVDEYLRRVCQEQNCLTPLGEKYVFEAEELDPCPCRERPQPATIEPTHAPEIVAGAVGGEDAINQVADAEANAQLLVPVQSSSTRSSNATHRGVNKPPFTNPVADVSDEQPVTSLHISPTSAGSVPLFAEKPVKKWKKQSIP